MILENILLSPAFLKKNIVLSQQYIFVLSTIGETEFRKVGYGS